MKLTKYLLAGCILTLSIFISCEPFVPEFPQEPVEAFRPIYASEAAVAISRESGRDIHVAGKIYSYGDVLLVNEVDEGIHVFDNSDPENPENLFFISIPGNTDLAFTDGVLYANNMADLVALNITLTDFEIVQRFEGLFFESDQQRYPPGEDVYFECVDPDRGRVIAWEPAVIDSPDCYKK